MKSYSVKQHTEIDCCEVITYTGTPSGAKLIDFLRENIQSIDDLLIKKGSVILTGFDPMTVDELSESIDTLGGQEVFYRGGLGPRTKVGKAVYTASDISKIFPIKMHQEMSYQDAFPDNIVFYCNKPAEVRGETTLANIRKITADIPVETRKLFSDKGVRYVSVFHDKRHTFREKLKEIIPLYLHLNWQDAFGSDNKQEVEEECARRKLVVHWRENGDLETTAILPAFRFHPVTNEEVWFNSVISLHFNPRALVSDYGNLIYYFRKLMYRNKRDLPNQIYFGDGSPITYEQLLPIYTSYDKNTYHHLWKEGDLMLIDNRLVAHGRNSFRGTRKVYASLINQRFISTEQKKSLNDKYNITEENKHEANTAVVS